MFSRIRDKVGTAGLIVAVVALVAALGGGAYAASGGGLTGKQKKEVRKISKAQAKKLIKAGPAGPAGAQGAPGATGPAGANGAPGAKGDNGANGKGVVVGTEAAGINCADGGVNVEVEDSGQKQYVCNGDPAEFPGILPEGKTETGSWGGNYGEAAPTLEPISWNIPLESAPEPVYVGDSPEEIEDGEDAGCLGLEPNGTPTAEPGKLCVYLGLNFQGEVSLGEPLFFSLDGEAPGASPTGTGMFFTCESGTGLCLAGGTWAVTAG